MGDRFLLHGGVHHNPFEIIGLDRSAPVRHREALLQQRIPHPGQNDQRNPAARARLSGK